MKGAVISRIKFREGEIWSVASPHEMPRDGNDLVGLTVEAPDGSRWTVKGIERRPINGPILRDEMIGLYVVRAQGE